MAKVGTRRLYESLGCGLADATEFNATGKIGEVELAIYLGTTPVDGIQKHESDVYLVPPVSAVARAISPRWNFFAEIKASIRVDIDDETWNKAKSGDPVAHQKVLEIDASSWRKIANAQDVAGGILGLRFHWQFVVELINELNFAWLDDYPISSWSSSAVRMLEEVSLNRAGEERLLVPSLTTTRRWSGPPKCSIGFDVHGLIMIILAAS